MNHNSITSPFVGVNYDKGGVPRLPWWTWVLPFFVANLGTWLSIWFKTDPGAALWYLPTAFGIVMVYWWGPRVLVGIYLNAVICAPLWDLPWQWSFLYALPETLEVGLSWLLFVRFAKGKYWLPDLRNVGLFLALGSLIPTIAANSYLVLQLYFLGDIPQTAIWENWRVLISADMTTQFVFAVPILVLSTRLMMNRGLTDAKGRISELPYLPAGRDTLLDKSLLFGAFVVILIIISLFPIHDLRGLYGLLMIFIAVRYGVKLAILSSSWVGFLALLLSIVLKGNLGLPTASYQDFLTTNFDILFLCGVTLVTGRAISDLFTEVIDHKQAEKNLLKAETKYRTLVEQIPPIIYTSSPDQHIGVTYISPRIKALGFGQEEWIAEPDLWFKQIHPEDQKRILSEIEQNAKSKEPFSTEYRLISRDGKTRWFLDEVMNIVDTDGRLLFRQGFMLDITERKQIEESLSARERYLELLNGLTRTILLSTDFDSTFHTMAFDLKKIIDADDCYILRWDEEKQVTIPVTTTAKLDFSFSNATVNPNDLSLTASILQAGHVLVVEDIFNSPYISLDIAKRFPAHSIIGVPLIAGEHKLGAAVIAYNTPHHFTSDEIERTEQAGSQVALALWNFQQSVEIQQRLKQSHTLTNIGRALSETEHGGSERVLQLIVDSALDLIPNAEQAVIHIVAPEENVLNPMAIAGFSERAEESLQTKMQMGKGVAGQVIRDGITINISNVAEDPRFLRTKDMPKYQSLMVAPIQSGGRQIGTISMQSKLARAFSTEDENLLNALAVDAAIAIDNTRSFEATQQSLKEVNALYGTIQVLAASLNAEELAKDVVALLQKNFGYYYTQLFLLDPLNADLVLKAGSGEVGEYLLKDGFRMPRGTGISGHAAETGTPFFTNNVNDVVFFQRNPLLPDTQFELAVPIKIGQVVVGVLDIQDKPPRQLSQRDLQLVQAVGDQLAVALHKANLYTDLQNAMKLEQSIRSQLIQSERLALVGRLLASVSHELNNPLQAIHNALFLLKEESGLSIQGRQDLDIVLSEAERMAALIERLRSAYRPIRGKDFQPVQLNNLIEDVYALIGTHMRHKDIVFEFIPDPDLQPVFGISDQLRQVVLNLFLNAIEVMNPGGCLTVQTQNLVEQSEVLFTVKDTGPGIDAEILPHIFDAFITSKHTGTGLGLTISHDILEQHHGRVRAENNPQGGAIFLVWLPMAEKE